MKIFEKSLSFLGGLGATSVSMLVGASAIRYLYSFESSLVAASKQSSGCVSGMYFFFYMSLIFTFFGFIISVSDEVNASQEEIIKTVIGVPVVTNFLGAL